MELHEAIKTIVDTFGKDIISERRFLNMVADYYSFKDNPAGKMVLSALVNGGYLSQLIGTLSEKELSITINQIKKEVENNYGFRPNLIDDILTNIIRGLNLKVTISPLKEEIDQNQSAGSKVDKKTVAPIQYFLKKRSTINSNYYTYNALGYYNADNDSFIILKGSLLAFQKFRDAWLTKDELRRKRFIDSHCEYVSPNFIAKSNIICASPNEAALVVTGSTMIGKIVWVDSSGKSLYQNDNPGIDLTKIDLLVKGTENKKGDKETFTRNVSNTSPPYASKLTSATPSRNNGKTPQGDNKARQTTSNNNPSPKNDSKKLYLKIIPIISIFVIGAFYVLNYLSSSAAREQYENKIFSGNTFVNSGNYDQAVESYKDAYSGYNAMNSSSYKEEALVKIDAVVDKLIKEGETNNKSLAQAYKVIESELQLTLRDADKERLTSKKIDLENMISERTDNGRNTLITILSANKGKLDENGLQLLNDLLLLAPNDYWLNFIKKKNDEQKIK